jgi:hypothetical protein
VKSKSRELGMKTPTELENQSTALGKCACDVTTPAAYVSRRNVSVWAFDVDVSANATNAILGVRNAALIARVVVENTVRFCRSQLIPPSALVNSAFLAYPVYASTLAEEPKSTSDPYREEDPVTPDCSNNRVVNASLLPQLVLKRMNAVVAVFCKA